MSEETCDPEIARLEAGLKSLSPAPSHIDRDALLFQAGQASARPHSLWWLVGTLVLASLATTFGVLWQQRPAVTVVERPVPQFVERIVYVQVAEPEQQPTAAAESDSMAPVVHADYLRLRNQVLRSGVEALPPLPPTISWPAPADLERPRFFDDAKNSPAAGDRS